MKLLRLTQKGIAHYVVPLSVVALVAVVGTAILVKSHAATCTTYQYGYGGSGTCVKDIQILANHKLGAPRPAKLTVDGQYGNLTKNAIIYIQGIYGLSRMGLSVTILGEYCAVHQ